MRERKWTFVTRSVADAPKLDRELRGLRPILPGARVEVRGGINRPPLERTPAVRALFRRAQSLMREMGLPLGEACDGRRLGREFYGRAGRANARRAWSDRRRRA